MICAPTRTIVALWVSQALAERDARSAFAPVPLKPTPYRVRSKDRPQVH
jgi:hypothetical protein